MDGRCNAARLTKDLEALGWGLMNRQDGPFTASFVKGYTPEGFAEKVYHLHVKYFGDWNELYFRDFLLAHRDAAAEYGRLKLSLLKEFKHNRDGYTNAKTDFVLTHSAAAKREFENRYKPCIARDAPAPL
jgi:GrpB-like predicted nucleotidyltransferase (UPF0157 family)